MTTRSIKKDIAIIGMSGRFPKSENILEFWNNLVNGKELIHFYSDSELEGLGVNPGLIKNERFVRNSSFLEDSGSFDYSFFGYTKEEAALMDPQIRIIHEQAWLSLEDAGYNPFNYPGKIGCFCTASDNLIWRAHVKMSGSSNVNSYLTEQISNPVTLSTLVSYSLNLKGPSYFVDTACSSSLVAIHIAVRSLLLKECSMALAGGVCVKSSTNIGYVYEDGMIYSKDGHCKAFDVDSSGTVKGEGAGIVVLKRLEDALRDRDHIYGVIRASSVNNDGNRKIGYTAPSVTGQYECIKVAHQIAEIEPKDISYIEAHGTGTKLGDSVEIESLNKAFNFDTSHRCGVGSLKTNIGHLDAAAGVAGLIKATLSIKHRVIPASLHYTAPNPEINFASGPFYVNSELKEWVSENQKPLIAGINSFGIGGTNAHIVLEEPPIQKEGSTPKSHQLLLFSARTKTSIERYQQKLSDFLEKNKNLNLADLSYTLKTGRKDFRYRKFVVCKDIADAQIQLGKMNSVEAFQTKERKGVVFMFSGQGSQYYGMGKQIYSEFPYFRSIVYEGFRILKNETGNDYKDVIGYNDLQSHSPDLVNDTLYTQPLLFLLEYAFAMLLLKLGIRPTSMIGHSLGEYVAACISEVFSFEDGLKLILKRAQLMSQLEGGSMLSIDLPADKAVEFIPADLSIAGINTDNSCVISGNNKSIGVVSELLSSRAIPFVKLKTSHAFHSPMMDPILSAYEEELNKVKLSEPKIPYISCITGLAIKKEEAMSSKYWMSHIRKTVNFSKGLDALLKEGHTSYIEIGGKSLINLLRQRKNYNSNVVVTSVTKHPKETEEDSYYLLNALGTLWSNGTDINWGEYYSGEVRNKIPVPTYSFDKIVFPVKVDPLEKLELERPKLKNRNNDTFSEWIYEQNWKEIKNETFREIAFDWTVCFVGESDFSRKLKEEMRKESESVIFVRKGINYIKSEEGTITINPLIIGDYEKLMAEFSDKLSGTGRIVHAWCVDELKKNDEAQELGYFSLLNIARTFLKNKTFTAIHVDYVVTDLFKVNGNEQISAIKSPALAALKVIPKEYENVYCRCIEFIEEDFKKNDAVWNNLFSKLKTSPDEPVISIRGNKAWKPFYENVKVNKDQLVEAQIKTGGVYVITGAYGGMGKAISEFLAKEFNSDLILIGRREADRDWINSLRKESNSIHYIQDDLSDLSILGNKINDLRITYNKKVTGIFHTAGLGDYAGLIADRTKEHCEEIFLPKIKGTDNLFNVFKGDSPNFLVLCSSTAAVLSPFGQVAYVAANMYQNFFALEHNSKTKIVSILWDAWKETGMAIKASNRYLDKTETLALGISNKEGIEIFNYALNSNSPEIIVSIKELNSRVSQSYEHTLKRALEFANKQNNDIIGEVERPSMESVYKAAETETERVLCELWKSIFGYEKIGINDDFFELGGDSLKVMTVVQRIHKSFNIEISIGDFFKKSNIEELAKEIDLVLQVNELNKSVNEEIKSNQIRL